MLKSCSEGPSLAVRHLPRCHEPQNLGLTVWGVGGLAFSLPGAWPTTCFPALLGQTHGELAVMPQLTSDVVSRAFRSLCCPLSWEVVLE